MAAAQKLIDFIFSEDQKILDPFKQDLCTEHWSTIVSCFKEPLPHNIDIIYECPLTENGAD